jgi:hypothetical protein
LLLHRYGQEHVAYRIDVQQNKATRDAVRTMFTGPTAAVGGVLDVYQRNAATAAAEKAAAAGAAPAAEALPEAAAAAAAAAAEQQAPCAVAGGDHRHDGVAAS